MIDEDQEWLIKHYKARIASFVDLKKRSRTKEERAICDGKIKEAEMKLKELYQDPSKNAVKSFNWEKIVHGDTKQFDKEKFLNDVKDGKI